MLTVASDNMTLLFLCYIQTTECQLKLSPRTNINLLHAHALTKTRQWSIDNRTKTGQSSKDLPSLTEAFMPVVMHSHKNNLTAQSDNCRVSGIFFNPNYFKPQML